MSGLALRTDAVRALQSVLRQEEDVNVALDAILSAISKKISTSGLQTGCVVDLQTVEEVVTELTKNVDDRLREALSVVDAYDAPRLCYDPVKKSFYFYNARSGRGALESDHNQNGSAPSPGSSRSPVGGSGSGAGAGAGHAGEKRAGGAYDTMNKKFHGTVKNKVEMFRERFQLIKQRVLRNPLFCRPSIGGSGSSSTRDQTGHIELTPIDSLLGARGTLVLLGVLTRQEEGKYFLEDLNGSVEINLSNARVTDGLFTLGCIVVVEGTIGEEVGMFYVNTMGFPPPESRRESLNIMSSIDVSSMTGYSQQEEIELQRLEKESEETMFVMLSDVHLDSPEVLHKLRMMFEGFSQTETPPAMFVFMGNFTSQPFGKDPSDVKEYQKHFNDFGELLLEFPNLIKENGGSKFLFVPGPNDPGAKVLPRSPIPSYFTKGFIEKMPKHTISFTTNPCRIKYFTQEIVVYRDDILNRMRRQCVIPPIVRTTTKNDDDDDEEEEEDDEDVTSAVTEHLVKTVLDQGHLCPLPMNQVPVRWSHDASLRLYPLPDLLMMADHYDQYHSSYQGCAAINPGSFPTDFSFVVYRPYNRQCEFSRIG